MKRNFKHIQHAIDLEEPSVTKPQPRDREPVVQMLDYNSMIPDYCPG